MLCCGFRGTSLERTAAEEVGSGDAGTPGIWWNRVIVPSGLRTIGGYRETGPVESSDDEVVVC